ncbi:DNA endonuclease RBBP8-like [Actinia tenebrosa]|uniref:DNA endonuclease RBBP8-like n=1 Tax=Actinia tenebrosa TaxID=6105 RepID=A0A6P8J2G6_ACTTE|nr:DNA endonuclease RBBP8-like [Actinia tenebrosa]
MPKRGRERWRDPAYTCRDCEAYYASYSQEERERRVQTSCRHRSEHRPAPRTPPGFWSIDFPTSPEILASGMMIDATNEPLPPLTEEQKRRRRMKRKRRLDFLETEKKKKEVKEKEKKEEKEKQEDI